MALTSLIITDKQELFRYYESAFRTGNIYAKHSFFHLQEVAHKLVATQPDILLIETSFGDKIAQLLSNFSEMQLARRPAIFVCLENRTSSWEQLILRKGAMYVFDKTMSERNIVSCVIHLYSLYYSVEREEKLFPELVRLLRDCGFSPQHRGYACIVDSVQMLLKEVEYYQSLTKKVYPHIARKQSTTPIRVEKNIRDAIRHAWSKGDRQAIQKYLGFGDDEKPPSNGKLISSICERLRETLYEKEYSTVDTMKDY